MKKESIRKKVFYIAVGIVFVAIFIMNCLTPIMSDDYNYAVDARNAGNLWGIFVSEYHQYIGHTGRSVAHFILKCFLSGDKWIFNICNSVNFVVLSLLIYYNVEKKKKYDVLVYGLINVFLWLFSVRFGETILWETGSCNYLWGTTFVMGFVSAFRYCCNKGDKLKHQAVACILLFLFGVVAGWCNENTSGGGILAVLLLLGIVKLEKRKVTPCMICGLVGNIVGYLFLFCAPGNWIRVGLSEEQYGGIALYLSRIYKITLEIEDNFFVLLCILLGLFLLVKAQGRKWKELKNGGLFFLVFLATCYSLTLIATPMSRAYFGAGVFLMVACTQLFAQVIEENKYVTAFKQMAVGILLLYLGFAYLDGIVNVARVYRDYTKRDAYILEQKAAGNTSIEVPLIHEGFETPYSFGYDTDFAEDSGYWVNNMALKYYGVGEIIGVPNEEWRERYPDWY